MTVIVTNAKNRIAYNIVRSLGQKGINVITSDSNKTAMSFSSRYSNSNFIYPSPFNINHTEFVDCMINEIIKHKARVLIPVLEETYLVSKYKKEFLKHTALVVPDYDQILLAHNKDKWEKIANDLNIRTPVTYNIEELKSGKYILGKLPYPLLIKPKQGGGGWGINQINSEKELEIYLSKDSYLERHWERFYIQEKIDGHTVCVAMLFNKGKLRAKVAYKQLREYPVKCGQATMRISINSPHAEGNLQLLLEHLLWHGVCQADFIIEKDTGLPYLVDLNPRFWGSLIQGIASGVDFPFLYYQIALEGDVKPVLQFRTNVITRWIGGDLCTFFPSIKVAPNKFKFVKDFLYPSSDKVFKDDFSFNDPFPFLLWCFDAGLKVLKSRSVKSVSHDSLDGIWE